jgi:glutathionylspermidine synthase
MIELKSLSQGPEKILASLGWNWMLGSDTLPYVTSDVVKIDQETAEIYYEGGEQLYEMLREAAKYVVDSHLFREMGIPDNLIEMIQYTWADERHVHLYSRLDLSLDEEGKQVKLIECNADTATCLPETAVVQWAQLKSNGLDEGSQYNTLHEELVERFEHILELNDDLSPSLLFSTLRGYPEDDSNVSILMEAAKEAGFDVAFAYIDEVDFSEEEGVFMHDPDNAAFIRFDFWFKLIPWEFIGNEEKELTTLLTSLVKNRKVVVLNPAYTLLYQSKYILKVLWDLYPYHPLLLQTERHTMPHKKSVAKVLFGREGANVSIIEKGGDVSESVGGDYGSQPKVYQEYFPFQTDASGHSYQAGLFYVNEACALGFRRGGKILDNTAQFVGHVIE